ncbi:MAG TPA: YaiO family outer membrane beta-barrel protein [Oxalicibacterium sp.]|uniref:YaiO family outer membrane beta-barrel protein n=1 Tax=Oxalicibacterium sp. TaxID=2766525 RepID=UPI002CF48C30|nr:YaiO family outer membrane beta-barrel protein [Oxalicibacterium sp.]HWU97548.1 YaiO family outer membrane beta-barrel protein [Oxalicibacterium sp.]
MKNLSIAIAIALPLVAALPFPAIADTGNLGSDFSPAMLEAANPAKELSSDDRTTIGVRTARERLSNDSPDWTDSAVSIRRDLGVRHLVEATLVETERFDLSDTQINALYSFPVNAALTATLEGNTSPTHRVLAKNAFGGTLQYEFAPAWLLHGGGKSTRYDDVRVNQGVLMLEHYFSSYSWLVGWRPTRAFGTTAHAVEARGAYYYGDKNSATILIAAGKEAASIGTDVTLTSVRSLVLIGRHWLDKDWAFNYSIGHTRQGDLYERNGIDIGVQYNF